MAGNRLAPPTPEGALDVSAAAAAAGDARRGAERAAPAPAGLVTRATTRTPELEILFPLQRQRDAAKELGRTRRARRTSTAVRTAVSGIEDDIRAEPGGFRYRALFLTVTYAPGRRYRPGHIRDLTEAIRKHLTRRGYRCRYVWVQELQTGRMARTGEDAAAVVHWHVVVWVPVAVRLPAPDSCGWWPHGMTKVETARNPTGYLAKYASKGSAGADPPKGSRLCGRGGLDLASRTRVHRALLPAWLAALTSGRCRRVPFVGWVDVDTGEAHVSPFSVHWEPADGGWRFVVLRRE